MGRIINDMEGDNQRPKTKHGSICDPFVFILREDDTIGLFIGESERGKIRRKDISPTGEKDRHYYALFPYTNRLTEDITLYCWLILQRHSWHILNSRERECAWREWRCTLATSTLQVAMTAGQKKTQWLMLGRPVGVVEVSSRHVILSITTVPFMCRSGPSPS